MNAQESRKEEEWLLLVVISKIFHSLTEKWLFFYYHNILARVTKPNAVSIILFKRCALHCVRRSCLSEELKNTIRIDQTLQSTSPYQEI